MTAMAVRFQTPKNQGRALVGLSVLALFSQFASRTLASSDLFCSVSGEQVLRVLPLTSICEIVACWLPAWARLFTTCPWMGLIVNAFGLLYHAL